MIEYNIEKNEAKIGAQLAVFHCNHYNLTLQRTIIDAIGEKGRDIQVLAAMHSTQQMLLNVESTSRKIFAINSFTKLGFGTLNCEELNENGGQVKTPISHYALAWFEKFGPNDQPICYFNSGYILGLMNAIYGLDLGPQNIEEIVCRVTNPESVDSCVYEVKL